MRRLLRLCTGHMRHQTVAIPRAVSADDVAAKPFLRLTPFENVPHHSQCKSSDVNEIDVLYFGSKMSHPRMCAWAYVIQTAIRMDSKPAYHFHTS
jgi:hypothetical protein